MLQSTLKRYLAICTLKGILLAFLAVMAIIMLVDFVEASRNIGMHDNVDIGTVLFLTLLRSPHLIEQTIPFIVLFGVMSALYSLNRRSELIVLRAAGLSAWRFLTPAITVSALVGLIWSLLLNPMAAKTMSLHDNLSQSVTGSSPASRSRTIWLREGNEIGQTVIYASHTNSFSRKLNDVTFYLFTLDDGGTAVFERRLDAKEAELLSQGYWQLRNVSETAEGELPRHLAAVSIPTTITLDDIQNKTDRGRLPPFWKIPSEIAKTQRAGFSTVSLRIQLHKLLALPVMLIAMTILAAGVSTRLTRSGQTLRLLVTGGALGFLVYFANNVVSAFGEAGILPIILAVWTVPLLALFLGLSYLSHLEDG